MQPIQKNPLLAIVVTLCMAGPASAITNGTAPEPDDTRFDAVGALALDQYLGQSRSGNDYYQHSWWCTVTLIAPNLVLTAQHCIDDPDRDNWMVRFRRQTDGSLGTIELGSDSFFHARVQSWDIPFPEDARDYAIGTLTKSIHHISPIPVITRGQYNVADAPVIQAGWGKEGPEFNEGPKRELLLCDNTANAQSIGAVAVLTPEDNGCGVNMHDSGSPVLMEDESGDLRVTAVVRSVTGASSLRLFADLDSDIQHTPFEGVDFSLEVPDWNRDQVIAPGESLSVLMRGGNYGATTVRGTVVAAKFSTFPSFDSFAVHESRFHLKASSFDTLQSYEVPVRETMPRRTYFLRFLADPDDRVSEAIEENNSVAPSYISVTPVKQSLKQLSYQAIYQQNIPWAVGYFMVGVQDDGDVTVIGGINDDYWDGVRLSRVFDRQFHAPRYPVQFRSSNGRFQLVREADGRVVVQAVSLGTWGAATTYTVQSPSDRKMVGRSGHVAGLYRGWRTTSSGLNVPVVALVSGRGELRLSGQGLATMYDNVNEGLWTSNSNQFSFDQARQTWRLKFSTGEAGSQKDAVLYLDTLD